MVSTPHVKYEKLISSLCLNGEIGRHASLKRKSSGASSSLAWGTLIINTVLGSARCGRLPVTQYNQEGSNPFRTAKYKIWNKHI